MSTQPVGVWGIDLGQCGLKAIRLVEEDGQIVATAFDFIEHPKILSQPDADPDQLIREALEKFLSRNVLKGDVAAISVPGQSGLARFVKLPPVEEKKIGDIVRFEAKQQIPFNLDEVVWDYQKIGSGIVTDGFAMETEIGLFAMKRDMVNRYLQHFKDVNVDIHVVQMAPLALCNFVAFDLLKKGATETDDNADRGKRSAVVALDIGTDSSNLIITDGGKIIWQRPIPLGGNHFTRALTKDMKLTFAKAEHLKRNAIKSPELKKILASIKPVLNDFVGEVQRSLGYFTNTHRDVQIEYMIGLGNAFRLPGLQRYLAEKLQLDVRKLEKMERLAGDSVTEAPAFTENILTFAVAYGLAVQGLKQARLLTNLLPPEIRVERLIKAKKPWAAAAAAALLLAVGGMTLGYGMTYRAFGAGAVETVQKTPNAASGKFGMAVREGDEVLKRITAADAAFKRAKDEAEAEGKAIESIITGQKEQLNWIELSKFIDSVILRPDDAEIAPRLDANGQMKQMSNLPPQAETMFGRRNREALAEWREWRAGRSRLKTPDPLGDGIDGLLQFNILGVSTRYTSNVKGYWATALKAVPQVDNKPDLTYVRPRDEAEPAEDDKGWIVELRGYTYYRDTPDRFIKETLLQRIAELGAKRTLGWPLRTEGGDTASATAPAATAPTGGGTATDQKPARAVSHVVLYQTAYQEVRDNVPFTLIASSRVDGVLSGAVKSGGQDGENAGGSGASGGFGGSMPPPGVGATTPGFGGGGGAGNWRPLTNEALGVRGASTTTGSTGAGQEAEGGSFTPGTRGMIPPPGGVSGSIPPGSGIPGGGQTQPSSKPTAGSHRRTEFIILFVWREPTPSDELLQKKEEAPAGQTSPFGGAGGYGGSMSPTVPAS